VIYVDKETLFPVAIDLYDAAGGLYKLWLGLQTPLRVPGTGTALGVNGATELLIANFRDKHMTVATAADPGVYTDCPTPVHDHRIPASTRTAPRSISISGVMRVRRG
jgi:hypothetical protein